MEGVELGSFDGLRVVIVVPSTLSCTDLGSYLAFVFEPKFSWFPISVEISSEADRD
jgi:hypothetical protein